MITDFNSLQGGSIFDASQITTGLNETSEQDPFGTGFHIRSVQDSRGYTRASPDPNHHCQTMPSSMRTEWIKSQNLEMQGL